MENQRIIAIIAIDLSATFDTVHHQILTDVLNKRFNIEGAALEWFSNSLSPKINQSGGGKCVLNRKIIIYLSPLRQCGRSHFVECICMSSDDESKIIHTLEQGTSDIKDWMDANWLCMNSTKTKFLLVGSRQQLSKFLSTEINVNSKAVKHSACIRYLGAWG